MLTKKDLIGVWKIRDFVITSKDGRKKKWADEITGTIVYTNMDFMSVSINGTTKDGENKILFYSGTYKVIKGDVIVHNVMNASEQNRIGKPMVRQAELSEETLTLTANGDYGTAVLTWEKMNMYQEKLQESSSISSSRWCSIL